MNRAQIYGDGDFHFLLQFISFRLFVAWKLPFVVSNVDFFLRQLVQFALCINLSDVFLFLCSFFSFLFRFFKSINVTQMWQVTLAAPFYLPHLFLVQRRTEFIQKCIKNHSFRNEMSLLAWRLEKRKNLKLWKNYWNMQKQITKRDNLKRFKM